MSAEEIAAAKDVAEGIASIGTPCVLRRKGAVQTDPDVPVSSSDVHFDILVSPKPIMMRDASGMLIGVTKTMLTIGALGVKPTKADYIALNVTSAYVTSATKFLQVESVETLLFSGVEVKHEVLLND